MISEKTEEALFRKKWSSMKYRCYNKNYQGYKHYGGKGIIVSNPWLSYENFKRDMFKSFLKHLLNHGQKNTTLDRIESSKNYSKKNCKWSTINEQMRNRSMVIILFHNGISMTVVEWAEKIGITPSTLYARLDKLKWELDKALSPNRYNTNGKIL